MNKSVNLTSFGLIFLLLSRSHICYIFLSSTTMPYSEKKCMLNELKYIKYIHLFQKQRTKENVS